VEETSFEKEIPTFDPVELSRAKKTVESLLLTIKSIMIYPEDNPIPQEHKRKLLDKFSEFLETYEELKIEFKPSQLYYKGELIHQDYKEKESLAYSVHRDGVREITFTKNLTDKELSDLLEVFQVALSSPSSEDDLVTMLWEKDFDHISYQVIDEFVMEEIELNLQEHKSLNFENFYSEMNVPQEKKEMHDSQEEAKTTTILQNVKSFVKDEVIKIDELLRRDESCDGLQDVLEILEQILTKETELKEFNETVKVIEKTLDQFLEKGEFESAFKSIQLIVELEQSFKDDSPQRSSRLVEVVNRAGDSERIKSVCSILNQEGETELQWARAYLCSLNWNSIFNILNMLGELDNYPARRMVCDVLADFGKEYFDMVARGITDHRWHVVRNVVMVMRKIGDPRAIPYLKETIKHDQLQVRRETIKTLELFRGSEATQILLSALDDPSTRIRIRVFNLLGKNGERKALNPLLQIVKSKDFKNKSVEEKKTILFSLAELGKDEVVEELKRMAKKRNWFFQEKDLDTKALAIRALGLTNTANARKALEELSRKGKKQLREASQKALERVNRQLNKEGQNYEN